MFLLFKKNNWYSDLNVLLEVFGCWVDGERNEVRMWLNVWGNVCSSNWTTRSASRHFWDLTDAEQKVVFISSLYCFIIHFSILSFDSITFHFNCTYFLLFILNTVHSTLHSAAHTLTAGPLSTPAHCWAAASISLYIVWWSIFIKLWHVTTPGICMGRILMKRKGFHLFAISNREDLLYTTFALKDFEVVICILIKKPWIEKGLKICFSNQDQ